MKNQQKILLGLSLLALSFNACKSNDQKADGYGNFEATEITISAEGNGKLTQFNVNEGDALLKDALLGHIDTIQLGLKKKQLQVQKEIIRGKSKGVLSQVAVLNAKLKTANIHENRIQNLLRDNAGTQKQLDDIIGEITVIKQQIKSIQVQNAPIVNELKSIQVQLQQVEDQIDKNTIMNPINGTVLTKYAETSELTSFGKPLYKIADLKLMQLRVYISENQLSEIKIGQQVTVKIDGKSTMKNYEGTIIWIASETEFTPKIIQTKEERVALVYAVKINVVNDGSLKIGMPAEMWLNNNE